MFKSQKHEVCIKKLKRHLMTFVQRMLKENNLKPDDMVASI